MGQSFQPSLPVNQMLSPCPDHLCTVHQAHGEVASPRPKGRPRLAGPPAPGGEAAETLLTCEVGWGWSRSWRQRASERTPSSFSGYKACGQRWALRKLPQALLGTEGPPTGQVSPGQSWGKGPDTAPSCVSPNQPPRSPFSGPATVHPRGRESRADTEHPAPSRGWGLQTLLRGGSLPLPPCLLPLLLPLAGHCLGTFVRKQRKHSSLFTLISIC